MTAAPALDTSYAERLGRMQERAALVRRTPPAERVAKLQRLKDAITKRRPALQRALHDDFRKPSYETDFTEIVSVLEEIRFACRHLGRWMRPRRVPTPLDLFGTRSQVWSEPLGVVLIIGPWNYPFALVMSPLVAAIAAGNCAIVKPSELTPATSALMAELLAEAFEPDEVSVIQGGVEVAQALLALPVDHVFFTGSLPVGRAVMQAAARHPRPVTLELGGKSPAIVDATADLRLAAQRIGWAKFINAGQTCVAPDYVLVHEEVQAQFIAELRSTLERFYGADEAARQASPDLSRIINDRNVQRLEQMIQGSVAMGARVETGGIVRHDERYIAPTVLSGVTWDMPVMADEIFGPILPVLRFRALDAVYEQLRRLPRPLALYIFTGSNRAAMDIVRNTSAGGTVVNNAVIHAGSSYLPFGGVGASGIGSYHGEYGFRELSHERAVLIQGPFRILRHTFPPYGAARQTLLDLVLRFFSR